MGKFVVTLRYEVKDWWGLDELAADFADEPELFKQAAIELLREDVQEVFEGATWEIEEYENWMAENNTEQLHNCGCPCEECDKQRQEGG